jgi:hypothetical protein
MALGVLYVDIKYLKFNSRAEISHLCHGDSIRRTAMDKIASQRHQLKTIQTAPMERSLAITYRTITDLSLDSRNPRLHSKKQIRQIARSIEAFGFVVPVLIDGRGQVIAGHGRVLAAQLRGMTQVPTIKLEHLTESQMRAFMIADNRLTENSVWDDSLLSQQLKSLSLLELDFTVDVTGFEMDQIEIMIESPTPTSPSMKTPSDAIPKSRAKPQVAQAGDVWILDRHPVRSGNVQCEAAHSILIQGLGATAVISDPRHVDTIVRRWEKFTGREAVHQGTGQRFSQREKEIANAKQK